MKQFLLVLSWAFGLAFFFLFVLSLYSKKWFPSLFVLVISLLLLPPVSSWVAALTQSKMSVWMRGLLIPVLFILFLVSLFLGMGNKRSLYKSPEIEARLMAIYDARIRQWPVPYESRYLETEFGKVHTIISGPEDGPPVFLLHASAMASWSWLYNIEGMNRRCRTYAVDTIGDAGRSVLKNLDRYPNDGDALANLYAEIMDKLGVRRATFIGASQGGFIATNFALRKPERVDKLVLCGPLGYAGTNLSVLRILVTTFFPVKPLQRSTFRWAFGDDPGVREAAGEWFHLILEGFVSRQARPKPFSSAELTNLRVPVLLLLGKRDGLVGDPDKARRSAQDVPDIRVETLDTGHLLSAERADEFNRLVLDFLGDR